MNAESTEEVVSLISGFSYGFVQESLDGALNPVTRKQAFKVEKGRGLMYVFTYLCCLFSAEGPHVYIKSLIGVSFVNYVFILIRFYRRKRADY